jgi:hypothetical protein
MKFTTFAIAALASVASAEFNLHVAANKLQCISLSDPAESRVAVHGLTKDVSLEDLEIIERAPLLLTTVSAY